MSVNPNTGIKGMDIVLGNLNKEIVKMNLKGTASLLDAAAFLRRDMDTTPPTVPLDLGNLRASWFTKSYKLRQGPVVNIGFNANYAMAVHEMVDRKINWRKQGSGPKFLEAALNRNKQTILRIIANKIEIK